jgi:hypothetical protein
MAIARNPGYFLSPSVSVTSVLISKIEIIGR